MRQFDWLPNQELSVEVPVWIGWRKVTAVVDTVAQVTIVDNELNVELGYEAPVEKAQLHNAQTASWMGGGIVEGFGFRPGSEKSRWNAAEADIGDALIIGIDFLNHVKCKIDLVSNILESDNGDRVPMGVKRSANNEVVAVRRVVFISECEMKLGPSNAHRGKSERTRFLLRPTYFLVLLLKVVQVSPQVNQPAIGMFSGKEMHSPGILIKCTPSAIKSVRAARFHADIPVYVDK